MNKFFDYLMEDLPDCVICELLSYIRRFSSATAGDVPVEGKMGNYRFCASRHGAEQVRVHWVQVGRQQICVDAVV